MITCQTKLCDWLVKCLNSQEESYWENGLVIKDTDTSTRTQTKAKCALNPILCPDKKNLSVIVIPTSKTLEFDDTSSSRKNGQHVQIWQYSYEIQVSRVFKTVDKTECDVAHWDEILEMLDFKELVDELMACKKYPDIDFEPKLVDVLEVQADDRHLQENSFFQASTVFTYEVRKCCSLQESEL